MKKKTKSKNRQIIELSVSAVLALLLVVVFQQSYRLFEQNFVARDGEAHYVYVYPETTLEQLVTNLEENYDIASPWSFRLHAKLMHWTSPEHPFVRTGCYLVGERMADLELIRKFRNGQQDPIRLAIRSSRTQAELSGRLAAQLMLDSVEIASRLADTCYMAKYGLTIPQAVCLFIPNTYEVYWNISADELFNRMHKEYKAFWNESRLAKAAKLGLQPWEVVTLASIVEGETYVEKDKPIVAGLYLNRLHKGMLLQACPTVIFAWQDFSIRRVLSRHLEIDSPYNTYKYRGLPPGPIRIPSVSSVDATLNPYESNYLFMCASAALDGSHHFSSSYAEHARYAKEYQQEMNRRKIGVQN